MSRFDLSLLAVQDLEAIDAATIERFSLRQAASTRDRLFEAFRKLAAHPGLGHLRPDLSPLGRPFLYFTVLRRFMIVYEPCRQGIRVARVLDASQDLRSILDDRSTEDPSEPPS